MAKTYDFVIYDDDGKGVTSAITEYDRGDRGQLSYVGRAWLDVDETAAVVAAVTRTSRLTRVLSAARKALGASVAFAPKEVHARLCTLSDAFRDYDGTPPPSVFNSPWPSTEAPGHGD